VQHRTLTHLLTSPSYYDFRGDTVRRRKRILRESRHTVTLDPEAGSRGSAPRSLKRCSEPPTHALMEPCPHSTDYRPPDSLLATVSFVRYSDEGPWPCAPQMQCSNQRPEYVCEPPTRISFRTHFSSKRGPYPAVTCFGKCTFAPTRSVSSGISGRSVWSLHPADTVAYRVHGDLCPTTFARHTPPPHMYPLALWTGVRAG
jgi:hypothetical protein